MNRLRILLVDDHALVREGLKRVLETQADLKLVGEAVDGADAVNLAAQLRPDLILLDLSMPILGGIDAIGRLLQTVAGVRIVALTVHESEGYVSEFLKAGGRGYLLKRATTDELLRAIRTVGAGDIYVDPRVSRTLVEHMVGIKRTSPTSELSERENEILRFIALGYANKQIADRLELSVKSIETYKARAMEKLHLRSRVDIVRLACERGWYTPENTKFP